MDLEAFSRFDNIFVVFRYNSTRFCFFMLIFDIWVIFDTDAWVYDWMIVNDDESAFVGVIKLLMTSLKLKQCIV